MLARDVDGADSQLTLESLPALGDTLKSISYYVGYTRGEEIVDFTDSYRLGASTLDTRTIHYYGTATGTTRASDTTTYSYLSRTETYRDPLSANALKQIAFYKNRDKGYELIDWSMDYSFNGDKRKTTTVYYYYADASKKDCLERVDVYKDSYEKPSGQTTANFISAERSRTDPTDPLTLPATSLKTRTYYKGDMKGEEIIDYSDEMELGTTDVRVRTTYYYGTIPNLANEAALGAYRASDAKIYSHISMTVARRRPAAGNTLKQVTFYKNSEKGEELSEFSYEYYSDQARRKTTTLYEYDTTDPNLYDCLRTVKVYVDEAAYTYNHLNRSTYVAPPALNLKTLTTYKGNVKGDEIVDYVDTYKTTNGSVAKRTTYYYGVITDGANIRGKPRLRRHDLILHLAHHHRKDPGDDNLSQIAFYRTRSATD